MKMKWEKKIIKIGDSLGFIVPLGLLDYVGLKEGDSIEIMDDTGKHGNFISFWKKLEKADE